MDLALYTRVIWRFRLLVLIGFVLACALAFFSYARLSSNGISYRQAETWQSKTRLLITQPGFQIGKLSLGSVYPTSPPTLRNTSSVTPVASQGYLGSLAQAYVNLGNGDAVQAMFARDRNIHGTMTVAPELVGPSYAQGTLPILDILGSGPTGADAVAAAQRGATVFMRYFKQQQNLNGLPMKNRVLLQVLNKASAPQIVVARKKTLPIVIFIAVMTAALGLAFILENLRPRIRVVPAETDEDPPLRQQVSA